MADQNKLQAKELDRVASRKDQKSSVNEQEIEKQHQFQMFPTPDETFASEVIDRVDV